MNAQIECPPVDFPHIIGNMYLSPGDTFQASFFALGHATMFSNLVHGDHSFPLYEIGRQGGLTLVKLKNAASDCN